MGSSMTIAERALFDRQLSVGNSLICKNLVNAGSTVVGHIIKAESSNFKDILIQNKDNRPYRNNISVHGNGINSYSFNPKLLFIAFFKMIMHYFFGRPNNSVIIQDGNNEDEKSEFENCTIQTILIDKNSNHGNPKQIIELKNTTVNNHITFQQGTVGEVWLWQGSQLNGNVINGKIVKK